MSNEFHALSWLLSRRSAVALVEPGPSAAQMASIFQAAATVPDHGTLRPYRLVWVSGEARGLFGDALGAATQEAKPNLPPEVAKKVRQKAFAAPSLVALISSPREANIAAWEQQTTAACVGYAVTLAAHALGLGAVWKSAAHLDGSELRRVLAMNPREQLLGWILLGTHAAQPPETPRPAVASSSFAGILSADGVTPFRE
jgi:nitroreductase